LYWRPWTARIVVSAIHCLDDTTCGLSGNCPMTDLRGVSTSTEDYLEAILRLISVKGAARVRDIADALSVHKSTVSSTLKSLAEKGLVNYSRYEITTLTEVGQEIAQDVQERHQLIRHFLSEVLGIDDDTAEANACRMEHLMDASVLERLSLFVDFAKRGLAKGDDWAQQFQHYAKLKLRSKARKEEQHVHLAGHDKSSHREAIEGEPAKNVSTLDRLKPGKKASVVKVGSAGAIRRRMAEMGMVRGTTVEVVKVAPLGDPIEVKVKGYNLSLRKDEAAAIAVELP
jgi:DtxR family transcriptional regulator, Mn-dependent transcriptional regulator